MKTFKALIKREFWEHRGGMFTAPLIMAAAFAALMILGGFTGDSFIIDGEHRIDFSKHLAEGVQKFENMPDGIRDKGVQMGLYGPVVIFGFVALIISLFFALGSLYDERKDRSILFWKSLPVSDTMTVISKFVAITIGVPVCYFVVITAFQIFELLYFTVVWWFGGASGLSLWASSNLFGVMFNTLFAMIIASLWLAPLWAWLMLASAWAKRVAFLWGALPLIMVIVAEGWIFRTTNFAEMLGMRVADGFAIQNSNLHFTAGGDLFEHGVVSSSMETLVSGEFWIGLVVAAIFLAGAIYTRRFRDES